MKSPYEVGLPNGMTLIVELHDRPVNFEVVFPNGQGKVLFSREHSLDPEVNGKVDRDDVGKQKLTAPIDVSTAAKPKWRRIEPKAESDTFVEYSDPDM